MMSFGNPESFGHSVSCLQQHNSEDTVLESYSRMLARANEKTLGKLVGITQ